jgi:hypothetical protein
MAEVGIEDMSLGACRLDRVEGGEIWGGALLDGSLHETDGGTGLGQGDGAGGTDALLLLLRNEMKKKR